MSKGTNLLSAILVTCLLIVLLTVTAVGIRAHSTLSSPQRQPLPYQILLVAGTLEPEPGLRPEVREALIVHGQAALAQGRTKIHALVQLYDFPTAEQRESLRREGVELQQYIPCYTWMAAIPAEHPERILDLPLVRRVGNWSAADKVHPRL